jgi:NAD+ synthase (glutamine-hydrolysing)
MTTLIHIHQTHHSLADFEAIMQYLKESLKEEGLHLFGELFLTGYPLQDLVLQRSFILAYQDFKQSLDLWAQSQTGQWRALLGGVEYEMGGDFPQKIRNVVFEISPGEGIRTIYTKRLLPNYDIFDEQKYFTPGTSNCFYEFHGEVFGIQICEDMWHSSFHEVDPCELMLEEAKHRELKLSAIINLSASPFEVAKKIKRHRRAQNISLLFGCPFIYVNRVGGEDEILFDGSSFIMDGCQLVHELESFCPQKIAIKLNSDSTHYQQSPHLDPENTWEGLFAAQINTSTTPAVLKRWTDQECLEVIEALKFGLQEYASKNGFKKFLVALSGGMDSALVLALTKLSLKTGQSLEAIYMPSIYSAPLSTQLAEQMCQNLGIKLSYLPIKFLHSAIKNTFTQTFSESFSGLTDENVQSRIRGTLLYTRSNQIGAMVLNTSNKSELAVGYSTQYGDSVGALSILGDLYKTEVYRLARFINQHFQGPIPEEIIHRSPSAELRANQLDQDSLPPYSRLDTILEGILSYRYGKNDLMELGFSEAEITKVLQLYLKTEYKRIQFCPILKVKAKSFGFGYRIPISKNHSFYTDS